jgi:polar amino acid transport system substrate-binding protein
MKDMRSRVADDTIQDRRGLGILLMIGLQLLLVPSQLDAQTTQLRVGIKPVSPFVILSPDGAHTGISIDLWKEIARIMEVDYDFVKFSNTDALIQACQQNEVDLAIAAITMTPDRLEQVDFSNTMFNSSVSVAVRGDPTGLFDTLLLFFNSWLVDVLITLGIVLVVIGTAVWFLEMKKNPEFSRNPIQGIGKGIWWASVTMTGVGYGDTVPRSLPGRILGMTWMFLGVLMISIFTATVASSLTSQKLRSHIDGIADLERARVGAVDGENPITLLRRQGIAARGFPDLKQALFALAEGQLDAVVHDRPIIQHTIHSNPKLSTSIGLAGFNLRKEEYGIVIRVPANPQQRNTLADRINAALLQIKTSGQYDEILGRYLGF